MKRMKCWDAIIAGAGIVGLSLAIELRKTGLSVLIVDKGKPGREASWAAGGMLADCPLEIPDALVPLAKASARMYPEFVHELEDESGKKIDLREDGTLLFPHDDASLDWPKSLGEAPARRPPAEWRELEHNLEAAGSAFSLRERSVDPRHIVSAAIRAARHRGVDFSSGDQVLAIEVADGKVAGARTDKTRFAASIVINCSGAWAGQIGVESRTGTRVAPARSRHLARVLIPTRPVKGQMLCVVMPEKNLLRHVIRHPDVYLIPRSDGRLLIGATQEEAGFDKQTVPETIQKLRQAALKLVPRLAEARILEAWAGLRPGTPDNLPILGATATPGYFVATGHFRDGILLAPATAKVMAQVITGHAPDLELTAFSPQRFFH